MRSGLQSLTNLYNGLPGSHMAFGLEFKHLPRPGSSRRPPITSTWPIVALGFGAMLVLGAVVTFLTLSSIAEVRQAVLTFSDAQQSRREHIEALRSQIYVSSILVRDYLLDRRPNAGERYIRQLQANHASALAHLRALNHLSPAKPDPALASLGEGVQSFWESLDLLLQERAGEPRINPYEYMRTTVIPRRQAVIALAEELADTGSAEARAAHQAMASALDRFESYSVLLRIVTTLLAAALAAFTIMRVFRLERVMHAERASLERAEAQMRDLSQQVVTSQEHERRTLSRELHDHVGQMVTSLRFGLADLERQCPEPTQSFGDTLVHCRMMLEQTIDAVRSIAMGLRPSMLDDLGLAAAIEWQAREFSRTFNLPVTVDVDPTLADWPEPQRTALYRIAQEALTNCARHAKARSVRVELRRANGLVTLVVADDGVGIRAGERPRGFGMIGMQERVREMGGKLILSSPPGGGTMLEVEVPTSRVAANV